MPDLQAEVDGRTRNEAGDETRVDSCLVSSQADLIRLDTSQTSNSVRFDGVVVMVAHFEGVGCKLVVSWSCCCYHILAITLRSG